LFAFAPHRGGIDGRFRSGLLSFNSRSSCCDTAASAVRLLVLMLLLESGRARALARPEGRRTWMCGVFRPTQDAESENPGTPSDLGLLRRGIGPFFWLLFFGPAKKSDPLAGRRVEALHLAAAQHDRTLRPLARPSSFLLVDAKRNGTKEKRLPDEANPARHSFRDFSTRHPWLDRKTPHIHVRRPSGLEAIRARRVCSKPEPERKANSEQRTASSEQRERRAA